MSDPFDAYTDPPPTKGLARIAYAVRTQPGLFYRLAIFVVVGLVGLAILFGAVSFLNVWVLIAGTVALAAVVAVRSHRERQRQWWIDQNCCAECGYDLEQLPTRTCPECGRDATLDEPTWRRLRREHEAQFGRTPQPAETDAAAHLDEADIRRLLARAEQRD